MYRPIEIILADDHEIFRDGFAQMVRKSREISLVGEAANGEQLLQLARELQPDVIITDIQMPVIDGVEVTRQLTKELPHIGIIALSMYNEDYQIMEMIEAGARGYLIKNAHKTEVIAAIQSVYKDREYYCRETHKKLGSADARLPELPEFTEKEKEIICYICEQYSNKEIGDQMNISKRTVEWYREIITEKMKVKNTAGIVMYAIKHKIYKMD